MMFDKNFCMFFFDPENIRDQLVTANNLGTLLGRSNEHWATAVVHCESCTDGYKIAQHARNHTLAHNANRLV